MGYLGSRNRTNIGICAAQTVGFELGTKCGPTGSNRVQKPSRKTRRRLLFQTIRKLWSVYGQENIIVWYCLSLLKQLRWTACINTSSVHLFQKLLAIGPLFDQSRSGIAHQMFQQCQVDLPLAQTIRICGFPCSWLNNMLFWCCIIITTTNQNSNNNNNNSISSSSSSSNSRVSSGGSNG